jgi:CRISPR-associated endonuclease Csn1
MPLIFGFDIGTTSVGFAVIERDAHSSAGKILRLGVRVFPEARDPKGTPLNQERRQKRMARRQLRRRRLRRRLLNELLSGAGLLPEFRSSEWQEIMAASPYDLRRRALEAELAPFEVGRAIYHLAQRRHFRGRDLAEEAGGEAEEPDDPDAASDREATLAALKREGLTLGVWLAAKDADARKGKPPMERRRGHHAHRSVIEEEFTRLWSAQAKWHPVLQDEAFRSRVHDAIFAQRPVFWRKSTLGECPFMPGEALCPKGSWLSQQRRMLEKVNNLALTGGNARPLDAEERAAILAKLQSQESMTWAGVRSALRPVFQKRGEKGAERTLIFNLEVGGDRKLPGNLVEARLSRIFGDSWDDHPHQQEIRDAVHRRLRAADYDEIGDQRVVILPHEERLKKRERAAQSFINDFGVTREQADALKALSFPAGWEPYSTRALEAFLPHLEAGVRFGALVNGPEWEAWRDETFPERNRPTGEILDRLPSPAVREERERIAKLRNPTVVRTQNELRKVVNNLIGVYGKPDLIRIELARDVGRSKREREQAQNGIRRNEKRRREAAADFVAKGIAQPSHADIEKWLLWKECNCRCPYTGDHIGWDDLFGHQPRFDVEHIWPRWKSFDDSFRNKTLCRKDKNLAKSNRTPFEAFGNDPEWDRMKDRVWALVKEGKMAPGKAKRFCDERPLPDDFVTRQINDTGYAAREIMAQLKRLWPDVGPTAPVTVQAVTGRVTAQLRRLWELNNILGDDGEKTRADHRHHAIDALVVACCDPGMTNRLSRYWQAKDDPRAMRPDLPPPWPTIRADAERAVAEIVVSHRVRKKVSGPLHAEMPFGHTGKQLEENGNTYSIISKRMPVEKLTEETLRVKSINDLTRTAKFLIQDESVRRALLNHLVTTGLPPAKAYPPYPKKGTNGPEIRKIRALSKRQANLLAESRSGWLDIDANHHIAIYRLPNGKAAFEVVSLFEASRRLARCEPIVRRDQRDGATFVMSLAPGDAIEFPEGPRAGIWVVTGAWASGQVIIERHDDAVGATTTRPTANSLLREGARKVCIDPIGRARPAGD